MRSQGFAFPEAELRNIYETNADGSKGKFKTPKWVFDAIGAGETKRDYSRIHMPVLVFLATRSPHGEKQKSQYVARMRKSVRQ
jgi:hypothetical protein